MAVEPWNLCGGCGSLGQVLRVSSGVPPPASSLQIKSLASAVGLKMKGQQFGADRNQHTS